MTSIIKPKRHRVVFLAIALFAVFAVLLVVLFGRNAKSWIAAEFAIPLDPAFDLSPNGRQIVFTGRGRGGQNLYLLDVKTAKVTRLTDTTAIDVNPVFAPNGQSVFFASTVKVGEPFHIYRLSLKSGNLTQITSGNASDDWPFVSPDGKGLAFARATLYRPHSMGGMTWDDYELYTMPIGGTPSRLTDEKYMVINYIRFNPDGHILSFLAQPRNQQPWVNNGDFNNIYTFDVNKRQPAVVIPYPGGYKGDRRYSRDGRMVVSEFAPGKSFQWDFYIQHGNQSLGLPLGVSAIDDDNHSPIFAPGGESIYYLRGDFSVGDPTELWQVNTNGASPHRVAGSTLFSDPLHWKPSSKLVLANWLPCPEAGARG